jgi:hypothetical protein
MEADPPMGQLANDMLVYNRVCTDPSVFDRERLVLGSSSRPQGASRIDLAPPTWTS